MTILSQRNMVETHAKCKDQFLLQDCRSRMYFSSALHDPRHQECYRFIWQTLSQSLLPYEETPQKFFFEMVTISYLYRVSFQYYGCLKPYHDFTDIQYMILKLCLFFCEQCFRLIELLHSVFFFLNQQDLRIKQCR